MITALPAGIFLLFDGSSGAHIPGALCGLLLGGTALSWSGSDKECGKTANLIKMGICDILTHGFGTDL